MKRYRFVVELTGVGEYEGDAWDDAVTAFTNDPGEPSKVSEDWDQSDLDEPKAGV